MKLLRDSVWHMVHDVNGPFCTINAVLINLRRQIKEKTLTDEVLLQKLEVLEERVKRMSNAVDVHYKEAEKSKLWGELL